jgi:uncharacterized protein (TIGR04551 family)
MRRRRSPHVLLCLALAPPSFVSSSALAQGGGGTPDPAASAPPPIRASATSTPAPAARERQDVEAQGERPSSGDISGERPIFSEDWWGPSRPVIEVHGYFRTRAELFHNFFLGRHSSSLQNSDPQFLWPLPLDQSSPGVDSMEPVYSAARCGPGHQQPCFDKTESGANMRFRLDPEIDISDNLRIVSQIDLLDNVVLGSTPDSYANQAVTRRSTTSAANHTVYQPAGQYNAYAPVGFFASTQGTPTAGVNSPTNSISVKRVWAEYMTPVGQVRFGRMPSHWGLGMVDNSGDTIDSDYQTTTDRIMFVTGIRSMDFYFGGAWDFVSTGPQALPGATTAPVWDVYGGQPYNTCNLCNVNEWAAWIAHRTGPELQRIALSEGDVVVNGGLQAKFRNQEIDVVSSTLGGAATSTTPLTNNPTTANNGLEARHAWSFTPDLWLQILWNKLRIEAEGALIWGEIGDLLPLNASAGNKTHIREWGVATQVEYRTLEDKLHLQFDFGCASGDPGASNQGQGALQPPNTGVQNEFNTFGPVSTFRFHPDYRVDLVLFRNILTRVEGAYFFKPTADYDVIRHRDGEKLGGGASVVWSRASQVVQTPGHQSDLGVEIDARLYYQSKDGSLNNDPTMIGGFLAKLEYGVLFPLGGLNYLGPRLFDLSLSPAQIARLYLGVLF